MNSIREYSDSEDLARFGLFRLTRGIFKLQSWSIICPVTYTVKGYLPAVNIAVAWWIHLHVDVLSATPTFRQPTAAEVGWWQRSRPAGFGDSPQGCASWRVPSRQVIHLAEHPPPFTNGRGDFVDIGHCGWPFLSMQNIIWNDRPSGVQTLQGVGFVPVRLQFLWPFPGKWVPLQPLWLGFILNSILYGLIAWLTLIAAQRMTRSHRRNRRLKRGQCPTCAYPRDPTNEGRACPECGTSSGAN